MSTTIVGTVRKNKDHFWLWEADKGSRNRWYCEPGELQDIKTGDIVLAKVNEYGYYQAVRILARKKQKDREVILIREKYRIPHVFPDPALKEADSVTTADMIDREDWRDIPFVTIDPATAKDHDDAVHAEQTPDGGAVVHVAIADVSHYVKPDTVLDQEARKRGNSTYLANSVSPMLPEILSNDLCSLKENYDRPVLAVKMEFDRNGKRIGYSFHKAMIRSRKSLSYEDAQKKPSITAGLWNAHEILMRGSKFRCPLELHSMELEFVLGEDGEPESMHVKEEIEAHKLIEEMMVQANVCASKELTANNIPHLFRVHSRPPEEKTQNLRTYLESKGIRLRKADAAGLNKSVRELNGIEREVVLKSQSTAQYTPYNSGHFGLSLAEYTHFTSPIRRYADLTIHRALSSVIANEPLTEVNLLELGRHLNRTERRSVAAERDLNGRLALLLLKKRPAESYEGTVCGVIRGGLFIRIDCTGAEGFIPFADLGPGWYDYYHEILAAVDSYTGYGWQLGDKVQVQINNFNRSRGSLTLYICSNPRNFREILGDRWLSDRPDW